MKLLNPTDEQNIHLYLDGAISPAERALFESRLKDDARLREALENERVTRLQFRTRTRRLHAPAKFQSLEHLTASTPAKPKNKSRLLNWCVSPKSISPVFALSMLLIWSALLAYAVIKIDQSIDHTDKQAQVLQQFIRKHEFYFEGDPSLDVSGTSSQIDGWIALQVKYLTTAPSLGGSWRVDGARLDDFEDRRMVDILYFKNNGLDASLSVFDPQENTFAGTKNVTYKDLKYYVADDGWHRTIVWVKNDVGYALVGNIVIPADELFDMASKVRSQPN